MAARPRVVLVRAPGHGVSRRDRRHGQARRRGAAGPRDRRRLPRAGRAGRHRPRAAPGAACRRLARITFVATVGEEGLGDLRGVKQLFKDTLGEGRRSVRRRSTAPGLGVTNVGVGSLATGSRSRGRAVTASPPSAWRIRSMRWDGRSRKSRSFRCPASPKTTFNVGRVGGGTSVNSIPADAWMEVDMRSSTRASLAALDAQVSEERSTRPSPRRTTAGARRARSRSSRSVSAIARPDRRRPIRRSCEPRRRCTGRSDCRFALERELHRREHPDEPPHSGDHDRRRRPRRRRARASPSRSTRPIRGVGTERALLLTIALAQK